MKKIIFLIVVICSSFACGGNGSNANTQKPNDSVGQASSNSGRIEEVPYDVDIFYECIRQRDVESVRRILESSPQASHRVVSQYRPPLTIALLNYPSSQDDDAQQKIEQMDQIVELLIHHGADSNQFVLGSRAFNFLARLGRTSTMKVFLEAGCDINQTDQGGGHVLEFVRDSETLNWLIENGANVSVYNEEDSYTIAHKIAFDFVGYVNNYVSFRDSNDVNDEVVAAMLRDQFQNEDDPIIQYINMLDSLVSAGANMSATTPKNETVYDIILPSVKELPAGVFPDDLLIEIENR